MVLQEDIDNLMKWAESWNMSCHPEKCNLLTITNKLKPLDTSYNMKNHTLEKEDEKKYLGVYLQKT